MPMVEDREVKVQEKALQFIEENIFKRLNDPDQSACNRAWRLVDSIALGEEKNRLGAGLRRIKGWGLGGVGAED